MSRIGDKLSVTAFGESHGPAIGAVIEGLPSGFAPDMDLIKAEMARRAPQDTEWSTRRKEADAFEVISGMCDGVLTGAPLTVMIKNTDARSKDYSSLKINPRPGHADYTAHAKYGGMHDIRGGGHFSGRLTAPIVFAGALAKQILAKKSIAVAAHIAAIKGISDTLISGFDSALLSVKDKAFPVIDDQTGEKMLAVIKQAHEDRDSVGGIVECAVFGLPAGIGGPLFDGLEGSISKAMFGIPAVKGVAFGAGFDYADMNGSDANDAFYYDDGVKTKTNNCGGILGGISNGMPVVFKTVFKPTPSIAKPQQTVNLDTKEVTIIEIKGRHDPCVVPRAVPVVEAVTAIVVLDEILKMGKER